MRSWARPRWFRDRNNHDLIAYRVMAGEGNTREVPPGCYLAIHVDTDEFNIRTLVGPMDRAYAADLLEKATPEILMDLLEALEAQLAQRRNATLH